MTIIVVFLAIVGAVAAWWLSSQRLASKPWLEQGVIGDTTGADASSPLVAKIGLGLFLVVAGVLFALFISAYSMRLQMADWWPLPVPRVLWVNTGLLIASSLALEWTKAAARRADRERMQAGLLAGGGFAIAFLVGQLLAWRQLSAEGYFLASNPANSFFYLITGLHGLHVLGGLVALARTIVRARRTTDTDKVRLGIELCAIYWHFLLFVWLVLFALLTGWAGDFLAICRQVLT
jgi:cytochrome c oxidase subunit III